MQLMFRMLALMAISFAYGCGAASNGPDVAAPDTAPSPPSPASPASPASPNPSSSPSVAKEAEEGLVAPASPASPAAQEPAQVAASETAPAPGLAVGQAAPKFTLKDQTGQDQSLEAMLKKKAVALVFYRSADW